MRDVLAAVHAWSRQGVPYGLATVVASTAGPVTGPGDLLAVNPSGEVCGGVPAGCVESAVLDAATETLRTGRTRLARYTVGAAGPWPARPGCAGVLEVLLRRVTPDGDASRVLAALAGPGPVAAATVVGGPAPFGAQVVVRPDRTWSLLAPYATGDRGARDFLRARADLVTRVPCDGAGSPADLDTPTDLARAIARTAGGGADDRAAARRHQEWRNGRPR